MQTQTQTRENFATQINSALLADLRQLAEKEGRPVPDLVEEAVTGLLAQHRRGEVRPHVMAAHRKSYERFAPLYKKLA